MTQSHMLHLYESSLTSGSADDIESPENLAIALS